MESVSFGEEELGEEWCLWGHLSVPDSNVVCLRGVSEGGAAVSDEVEKRLDSAFT